MRALGDRGLCRVFASLYASSHSFLGKSTVVIVECMNSASEVTAQTMVSLRLIPRRSTCSPPPTPELREPGASQIKFIFLGISVGAAA